MTTLTEGVLQLDDLQSDPEGRFCSPVENHCCIDVSIIILCSLFICEARLNQYRFYKLIISYNLP